MISVVAVGREETRLALLRAAEVEMALHGVEGAELLKINQRAGQRNRSAVHHYFGSRAGVVDAIFTSHRTPINVVRNRVLDRLERRGDLTTAELVSALVSPAAVELADPSGRDYLVILADVAVRAGVPAAFAAAQPNADSLRRVNALLATRIHGSEADRRVLVGQGSVTAAVLLADLARSVTRGRMSVAVARRRVPGVVGAIVGLVESSPVRR